MKHGVNVAAASALVLIIRWAACAAPSDADSSSAPTPFAVEQCREGPTSAMCIGVSQFGRHPDGTRRRPKMTFKRHALLGWEVILETGQDGGGSSILRGVSQAIDDRDFVAYRRALGQTAKKGQQKQLAASPEVKKIARHAFQRLATMRGSWAVLFLDETRRQLNVTMSMTRIWSNAVRHGNDHVANWILDHSLISPPANPSLLFDVIDARNVDMLRRLLEQGVSPLSIGPHRMTPLHASIRGRFRRGIALLLEHDVGHDIKDADGMSPLSRAVEQRDYTLARLLVEHPTFFRKTTGSSHLPIDYLDDILQLLGHVPPDTVMTLVRVETYASRKGRLCEGTATKPPFFWRYIQRLQFLPKTHRDPDSLRKYATAAHILLNTFTYGQVTAATRDCSPNRHAYLETPGLPPGPLTASSALEFLLEPSHPLHDDRDLLTRLYMATTPVSEETLITYLARTRDAELNTARVLRARRDAHVAMDALRLGFPGQLDAAAAAVRMHIWRILPLLAEDLYDCVTGTMEQHRQSTGDDARSRLRQDRCRASIKGFMERASEEPQSRVFARLTSRHPELIISILADDLILDDNIARRNLYLLNATTTYPRRFPPGASGKTPHDRAVLSYLSTDSAGLTDMRYMTALLSQPFVWFADSRTIQRALRSIGTALVYGYVRPTTCPQENSLMTLRPSIHTLWQFLRHPTVPTIGALDQATPGDPAACPQSRLRPPQRDVPLTDTRLHDDAALPSHDTVWRDFTRQKLMDISHPRPPDEILQALVARRKHIFSLLVKSPAVRRQRRLLDLHHKILTCVSALVLFRLICYLLRGTLAAWAPSKKHAMTLTLDLWETVPIPAAHSLREAIAVGLKAAVLGRIGTRHHPWGWIPTFFKIGDALLGIGAIVCLYAWAAWTGDIYWLQLIIVPQILAALAAFSASWAMSEAGAALLCANFAPSTARDLAAATYLKEDDLLNWSYTSPAGIPDELTYNALVSQSLGTRRPRHMWEDTSDRNVFGVFAVTRAIAAASRHARDAVVSEAPYWPYQEWTKRDPSRLFRLEHPYLPKEDPGVGTLRRLGHTQRHPYDNAEDWRPPEDAPHGPVYQDTKQNGAPRRPRLQRSKSVIPTVETWERCIVSPPAFMHAFDDNVYLGQVQDPNLEECRRIREELGEPAFDPHLAEFLGPTDLLRVKRRARQLWDTGAIDLGHKGATHFMSMAMELNTLDFIAPLHRLPLVRRFTSRAFFRSLVHPWDYVVVTGTLEFVALLCTVPLYLAKGDGANSAPPLLHVIYQNPYTYLVSRKCPILLLGLGLLQAHAFNRLVAEVLRLAGIHMLLCLQAVRIGRLFSWQELQPYIIQGLLSGMQQIAAVRRVVCRRWDNMVEVTQRQLNTLFFGTLLFYPPFLCTVHWLSHDTRRHFEFIFAVYMVSVAAAVTLVVAALFAHHAYTALCCFAALRLWMYRLVDPVRSEGHALVSCMDKNALEPTLLNRSPNVAGWRFTGATTTTVCLILGLLTLGLAVLVLGPVFPETLGRWSSATYLAERYGV